MLLASPERDRRARNWSGWPRRTSAEVVAAVERDDDLEVAEALLDFAAQAAERLQAPDVRALDPRRDEPGDDQNRRRRQQRGQPEPED